MRYPTWRPDGSEITFGWAHLSLGGLCYPHKPQGIYEVAPSGGPARRLTSGCDTAAAWSPDGSQLAFLRQQGLTPGRPGMFVLGAAGGQPRQVWDGCFPPLQGRRDCSTGAVALAWSPDASQLVLTHADAFIVNLDGTGIHEIPGFGRLRFYAAGVSWAH